MSVVCPVDSRLPWLKFMSMLPIFEPEADLDRVDAAEIAGRPRSALEELGEGLREGDPASS